MACDLGFRKSKAGLLGLVVLAACLLPVHASVRDSGATLVLFNSNDPDSRILAKYYAGKRNIPPAQVVGLDCPVREEIQRSEYETMIADPLRKLFRSRGWWTMGVDYIGKPAVNSSTIRYVAIMRGMPLKIAADPALPVVEFVRGLPKEIATRNDASVDSELATLGMTVPSPYGIIPNPYFRRFTPILEDPVYAGLLLPARLDGPTPVIVRAMIDDSLAAEREGLYGWSYVDGRGITSGGYAEGDQWMGNLAISMRGQGLPVIFDNAPPTFPEGYPVTDAAVYYGWYSGAVDGPFAGSAFRFRRGAVAVHIHSFSAATLLSSTSNWCGPLLARGAAATLGNVYEPYLSLTANLDIFQDRLMAGFTLAESGWMSGFRAHEVASTALGAARMDAKDWAGAVTSFDQAGKIATDPAVRIRLDLETIIALQAQGKKTEATALALASSSALLPGPRKDLFAQFATIPLPTPTAAPIALTGPVPEVAPSAPAATPFQAAEPVPTVTPPPTPPPPPPIPELRP